MCSLIATDYAVGQPSMMENMTFGIEFEFLCHRPRDVSPRSHLSKVLEEAVSPVSTKTMDRDNTVKASGEEEVHVPKDSSF
ncbi:hypothetical protein KCU78_g91, partial [Aureobasidium melanogenum]